MKASDSQQDDHDIPWADPAIRKNYESELGRLILTFNEIDFYLSKLISYELSALKRDHLKSTLTAGSFLARLNTLDALASGSRNGRLTLLPIQQLRLLNTNRNELIHGHFDQNRFDGSYKLLLIAKIKNYPIERVIELEIELSRIAGEFRHADIPYVFAKLTIDNS